MLKKLLPLVARYAELSPRERAMLGVAAVALVFFMLDYLLVTPQLEQEKALAAKEVSQQEERAAMVALLNNQAIKASETLAQAHSERDALQATVTRGERVLAQARSSTDVAPLLRRLVNTSPGLQLIALRSAPSTLLFQPQAAATQAAAKGSDPEPKPAAPAVPAVELPTLYNKAVEATVQGNYLDLLTYLGLLRQHPGALFWDSATLTVNTYPEASIKLVLNMVSTQPDQHTPATR